METFLKIIFGGLLLVVAIPLFGLFMSLPVYWLWNGIASDLLHLRHISWLESWGLLVLCGSLFKSGMVATK